MGWIVSALLVIGIVVFYFWYSKTKENLAHQLARYKTIGQEVHDLEIQQASLASSIQHQKADIAELDKKSDMAIERYNHSVKDRTQELENYLASIKKRRLDVLNADMDQLETEMRTSYERQQQIYKDKLAQVEKDCYERAGVVSDAADQVIANCQNKVNEYEAQVENAKARYETLLSPLMQYERDKMAKLYYTIQLPEEYHDDIEFLLTTVAAKVQHPDIISKLVWAEYVKPNLDDTFKRIEIKDEPGIYKLTNLDSGKCYIGKSTNVKKRIADHFKSSVGIKSIADQAVHHAILKSGFWNWTIEVITYCDKDKLNELEKYYIDFFKAQEFGFNKNTGGGG